MLWEEVFSQFFGKCILSGWVYCSNFRKLWNDFATFWLSAIPISCIWVESSSRRFFLGSFYWKFRMILIRNYDQHFTSSIAWEEFCWYFISQIKKSFELPLINRLWYCHEISSSCTKIKVLLTSISFNRLLLAVYLAQPFGSNKASGTAWRSWDKTFIAWKVSRYGVFFAFGLNTKRCWIRRDTRSGFAYQRSVPADL